jgi:hypothetical protein
LQLLLPEAHCNAGILPACATSIPLALQLYGYGLGSDALQITAKIVGATVVVQKVESVTPSRRRSLLSRATVHFTSTFTRIQG